jgi:hypothetical protein
MSRRATLPGADELFRRTSESPEPTAPAPVAAPVVAPALATAPVPAGSVAVAGDISDDGVESHAAASEGSDDAPAASRATRAPSRRRTKAGDRRPTGRERHDEKITVYVSPEELVDIEQAKLILRAQHGLAVDRGRIMREAIAVVIADLEAKGEESILVRRLRGL